MCPQRRESKSSIDLTEPEEYTLYLLSLHPDRLTSMILKRPCNKNLQMSGTVLLSVQMSGCHDS